MKYMHSNSLIQLDYIFELDTRPVKKKSMKTLISTSFKIVTFGKLSSPKRAEPGLHPGPLNNTDNLSESVSIPRNSLHIRL